MATQNSIVSLDCVSKTYYLGNIPVNALRNVSITIPQNQICFIMGPSGSGKTTLLNLVGGIDSPTEGEIVVCGETLNNLSNRKLTKFRKRNLSFVFQFYSLIPTLTATENVELTLELIGTPGKVINKKAQTYLKMVELEDRMDNFPSQLSGGERQRVAIARALAKDPKLLLIDEPTGQLDQDSGQKVVALVRKIAKEQQKTVLLVTHDPELKQYADRVIELRSGSVIYDVYSTISR